MFGSSLSSTLSSSTNRWTFSSSFGKFCNNGSSRSFYDASCGSNYSTNGSSTGFGSELVFDSGLPSGVIVSDVRFLVGLTVLSSGFGSGGGHSYAHPIDSGFSHSSRTFGSVHDGVGGVSSELSSSADESVSAVDSDLTGVSFGERSEFVGHSDGSRSDGHCVTRCPSGSGPASSRDYSQNSTQAI